jgi:hypothetical protein
LPDNYFGARFLENRTAAAIGVCAGWMSSREFLYSADDFTNDILLSEEKPEHLQPLQELKMIIPDFNRECTMGIPPVYTRLHLILKIKMSGHRIMTSLKIQPRPGSR